MWAASQNNAAAVQALVELGADKNATSKLLSFPEFKCETVGHGASPCCRAAAGRR